MSEFVTSPQVPVWRRGVGALGAWLLGLVFLVAVWAKVLDPASFARTIENEGLALISSRVMAVLALALEAAIGVALILGLRRLRILIPTAALVAFFLWITGRAYLRYLGGDMPADADCGCFGNLVQRTPAEAFWQDLALMVPALLLCFVGRPRGPFPRARAVIVALSAVSVAVFAWLAPSLPLDDLATRLKPGADAMAFCTGADDERICFDLLLPEIGEGEHWVVLTALDEPSFLAAVDGLNERHWTGVEPPVWVLTAADEEKQFDFRFTAGPAFEVREMPAPLLRPLYRTLPRSFHTRDGEVIATYNGLPPLEGLDAATDPSGTDAQP